MYWTKYYRICVIAALCGVLTLTPLTPAIPSVPMSSSGENTSLIYYNSNTCVSSPMGLMCWVHES